jgi:hypothetical protein
VDAPLARVRFRGTSAALSRAPSDVCPTREPVQCGDTKSIVGCSTSTPSCGLQHFERAAGRGACAVPVATEWKYGGRRGLARAPSSAEQQRMQLFFLRYVCMYICTVRAVLFGRCMAWPRHIRAQQQAEPARSVGAGVAASLPVVVRYCLSVCARCAHARTQWARTSLAVARNSFALERLVRWCLFTSEAALRALRAHCI